MQRKMTRRPTVARFADGSPDSTAQLEAQIEQLMPRLRLAVIFGGNKSTPGGVLYPSQNTRSWKSYETVASDIAESLGRIGFRHVHLMPDDMNLGERLRRDRIHMAWLNTGGVQGCNPAAHAPALLELLGVPYVGHDPLAATTLDNKHVFKQAAVCAGFPTSPFTTWHPARGRFRPRLNTRFQRAFGDYPGPFVVKPVSGRASLNVHVAEDRATLPCAIDEVYRATANVVLIEKYLSGREFCIAVAGPITARRGCLVRGRQPFTFAALERVFTPEEKIFTSMDIRPITQDRCRTLDPRRDPEKLRRMRQLACDVFLDFNLRSLIRLDIRADETGELYILEANPKPDLKRSAGGVTSLISAGLPEAGMDYDDLMLSLLADRLDVLFSHHHDAVGHILDLLDSRRGSTERPQDGIAKDATHLDATDTDTNLFAIDGKIQASRWSEIGESFPANAADVTSLGTQTERPAANQVAAQIARIEAAMVEAGLPPKTAERGLAPAPKEVEPDVVRPCEPPDSPG